MSHFSWLIIYVILIYKMVDKEDFDAALALGQVPSLQANEVVWIIFEVGMVIDQRDQDVKQSRHKGMSHNEWWKIWLLADLNFATIFALRVSVLCFDGKVTNDNIDTVRAIHTAYQACISCNILIVFLLSMPYLGEFNRLGVLVITMREMISDVIIWSVIFVIVLIAFSFCIR